MVTVEDIELEIYADYTPGEPPHTGPSILPEDSYEGSDFSLEITGVYLLDIKPEVDILPLLGDNIVTQIEEQFELHVDEVTVDDLEY